MMTREAISQALQDRILTVICKNTGIARPTLLKLRNNTGKINKSIQNSISVYLAGSAEDNKDGG